MGVLVDARNLMLNALKGTNPATPITHAGLLKLEAGKAMTAVAATDVFTSTTHGYSDGNAVEISGLTGGAGLDILETYFIRDGTASTFKLCRVPAGTAVDVTTDLTVGTIKRLVEFSGGSPAYARKAIAFNAAGDATMDDSTNGALFDVAAGSQLDRVGLYSAVSAGTLLAVFPAPAQETWGGQGNYNLTDADLNALVG